MAYKGAVAGVIAVAAVILIAGCTATTTPPPTKTTSRADPAPSATAPTGDASSPATVMFPTDCKALIAGLASATSFATTPLESPPRPAPTSALTPAIVKSGKSLLCIWRDPRADISGISIEFETVAPAAAATGLRALPAKGFTCAGVLSGQRCQKISTEPEHGTQVGDTYFVRGATGIRIQQTNVPTKGLLEDVVGRVF
ncbi:hypothetical protein [Frondihabitans sucicola]|nr:hypothetical protein [Frondihabitans sucicola]